MGSQRYYRHFCNDAVELVDDDSLDGVIECLQTLSNFPLSGVYM